MKRQQLISQQPVPAMIAQPRSSRRSTTRPPTGLGQWFVMGLVAASFQLGPVAMVIGTTGRWDAWIVPEISPASVAAEPPETGHARIDQHPAKPNPIPG